MKKLLPLLLITVLFAAGCASKSSKLKSKPVDLITIEYKAITRGVEKSVVISKGESLTTDSYGGGEEVKGGRSVNDSEWKLLQDEVNIIDLTTLQNITPPSTKHQFDGALAAYIKIITSKGTYQTATFDHGNPPAELKPLIEAIINLSRL